MRRLPVLLLLTVAAVSVSSCGDDSTAVEPPGTTAPASTTAPTSTTVMILEPNPRGTVLEDPGPPPADTPVPPDLPTCPPECP